MNLFAICTSNHMFRREIYDKLPESIFENIKILKIARVIYPKNFPNQTCSHWLITPNQKALCIETNRSDNYRSLSRQLKKNFVNGAMLITINRVINDVIL